MTSTTLDKDSVEAVQSSMATMSVTDAPATSTTRPNLRRPTGFLDLPAELRNRIYDIVLVRPHPIYISSPRFQEPNISKTHPQIKQESLSMYFGSNTFISRDQRSLGRYLERLDPSYLRMVRDVRWDKGTRKLNNAYALLRDLLADVAGRNEITTLPEELIGAVHLWMELCPKEGRHLGEQVWISLPKLKDFVQVCPGSWVYRAEEVTWKLDEETGKEFRIRGEKTSLDELPEKGWDLQPSDLKVAMGLV